MLIVCAMTKKIENYAVYYGYENQEMLSNYDLIIVEPKAQNQQSLAVLKSKGAAIIAYISFVEIIPDQLESFGFNDSILLRENDLPVKDLRFGNYLANLSAEAWQNYLINEVSNLIGVKGYDGIFIDTIANIEVQKILNHYGHQFHQVYASLLEKIKETFPKSILIQNNGLNSVFDYSGSLIEGICWENPPIGLFTSLLWVKLIEKKIKLRNKQTHGKKMMVLLLEEEHLYNSQIKRYAKKKGWLYYKANKNYL